MTEVTIEAIAAGGDGVGRLPDGMTVFVPRTAPGDRADVEITERRRRWARGRLTRLVAPGPARTDPPCPHYTADECGGCQLQHLSLEGQEAAKRRIVGDALRRIGRRDVEDPAIVAAPQPLRYRAKVTLAIGSDGRIGFHPVGRPQGVFALDDCRIARPALMRRWSALRACAELLPVAATHIVLREDRHGDVHVIVRGGDAPWNPEPLHVRLADPRLSLWWEPRGGAARVVAGPRTGFPALAFAQVNPDLADRLRGDAVTALGDVSGKVVWDLYGGVGDAARMLAATGAHVVSVEADRSAVEWASGQGRLAGAPPKSPTYLHGRVEEVLHRLPAPGAVLLNPPRVGLAVRVAEALEQWAQSDGVRRVAYVSCDPATLARDLNRMPSLDLTSLRAYDLFPQTSHVETLAVLETT